ncbi:MAG TPA: nitronate monooxygenase [Gaiellaceae bacterium]|nr:nitronate monooxygenase [Gaiellaceae bacterium]
MRALDTPLCSLLGVRFPIVQAPMASTAPPALAAAVSAAGALGSIGAATLSPDGLREAIREVRAATDGAFAVNLFAAPYLRDGLLEVVLEERPPVFSFTFGIVDPAPLREAGIAVLGTATTADEARALAAAGVDAVVAQGAEAGGHRGSFLGGFPLVPLAELVPACVEAVDVPVVAAGGIVDGAGVAAALALGAQGVSLGTAFLFTPEAARPREHLEALRTHDTVVTDAYTGRPMRAARTAVLEELMAGPPPLPFPEQRKAAAEKGPVHMGGTAARRARELGAGALVRLLVAEAEAAARG